MARTELYVDPAIAADSGTGTVGDPYGDFQFCLDSETFDVTNGTRINVKAGTAEISTQSGWVWTTFGTTMSYNNPGLLVEGYTSAAGDGGIGEFDGNNIYGPWDDSTRIGIHLLNLKVHNGGAATLIYLSNYCSVTDCEVTNTTSNGIRLNSTGTLVAGCYVHDCTGVGVLTATGIVANYLTNGAKSFSNAIHITTGSRVIGNIISVTGNSHGIYAASNHGAVDGNSVYSTAAGTGTGQGIRSLASMRSTAMIANNIVEGFNKNYDILTSNAHIFAGNAAYNATTNYGTTTTGVILPQNPDNEVLLSSGFAKSGSDTFANRFAYFAPINAGNVISGAYPFGSNNDKGALQHADPAGGGGLLRRLAKVTGA